VFLQVRSGPADRSLGQLMSAVAQ